MAFLLAFMQGADAIEVDVRLTADRRLVAVRDESMKRTAGVSMSVSRTPFEKLRALNAGKIRGKLGRGQRVPLLEEVLAVLPPGKKVLIDLKNGIESIPILAQVLEKAPIEPFQVLIGSRDVAVLAILKEVLPKWARVLVSERRWIERLQGWLPDGALLADQAALVGATSVAVDVRSISADLPMVAELRSRAVATLVRSVNRATHVENLFEAGVEGIITDYPGRMASLLTEVIASRSGGQGQGATHAESEGFSGSQRSE